jgi:hypothetical protein
MEASQHSLLAACFTLHSINATLAIVPQRGAGLWLTAGVLWQKHVSFEFLGMQIAANIPQLLL